MTQKKTLQINLADFSKYPGFRYKLQEGDEKNSGERFREEVLLPALDKAELITVNLDEVKSSILPSFLDESFAGICRHKNWDFDNFEKHFIIDSNDPIHRERIKQFIKRD